MDLKCPNCGTPGVPGEGGSVVCTVCGGRFKFEAGEHHLAGVAEFDQLKKRVDGLEADNAKLRELLAGKDEPPAADGDPDEPDDQGDEDSDDEDEDF